MSMRTKAVTLADLKAMKQRGEKFVTLTAYDASFANVFEQAGVEVILVGDSLGMVVQGQETTLPVTLDELIYHCRAVRRGSRQTFLMADMPFMTYNSPQDALKSAGRLMSEGGAQMVKLEGGAVMLDTVTLLSSFGIPVCAHLGLLPQSVHKHGYRVQGKEPDSARQLLDDAQAMQAAGADMVLLECVPATLAAQVSQTLAVPVIGIGAGAECDSQVLVSYDMLGITPGKRPKFSHDFLAGKESILAAVSDYVQAVKSGRFPGPQHQF